LQKNGSIKTSLAVPWWEENKVRKELQAQGNLFQQAQQADLQKKIDDARRARIEADTIEKANSNKYMATSEHVAVLKSIRPMVWDRFVRHSERELIDGLDAFLKLQNLAPEIISVIMEDARNRHRTGIDSLQREFQERLQKAIAEKFVS
jgi:hypothetical protein